ncbi:MAG: DUF1489 domain-containing protein [Alphaproteobacteria bacterium]|nr:DUF1489 domain-containing protein [Alphaproteobacteria bacterium]
MAAPDGPGTAGPLHLLKLAVGAATLDHLREMRASREAERGGSWVPTRNRPRRGAEVLAGGSLYWVIRGHIGARQLVTGLRGGRDGDGRPWCRIEVAPEIVPTVALVCRPFQGWRYLSATDAPPDCRPGDGFPSEPLPDHLVAELRALGLL